MGVGVGHPGQASSTPSPATISCPLSHCTEGEVGLCLPGEGGAGRGTGEGAPGGRQGGQLTLLQLLHQLFLCQATGWGRGRGSGGQDEDHWARDWGGQGDR